MPAASTTERSESPPAGVSSNMKLGPGQTNGCAQETGFASIGTYALTCFGETYSNGTGPPLIFSTVPPSLYGGSCASAARLSPAVRFSPNKVMSEPGEITLRGVKLAALAMPSG